MELIFIEIIVANNAGFCGGVKRAVDLAFKNADEGVYSYGELVHNQVVTKELSDKSVMSIDNTDVKNSKVIIRSHGVKKQILDELRQNGNEIIDCVCPKVTKIYSIVREHYEQGYQVVIFGDENHPEVIGINSYADDKGIIIGQDLSLNKIEDKKTILVSQTTNIPEKFEILVNSLKNILNNEIIVYNTICNATRLRQESTIELAKKVEAMIVLGGKNSSNTKKLYEVAKKHCENVYLLESIKDLKYNIKNFVKIGITAGASTPRSVIEEAVSSMENFDNNEMMEAIENSFKRIKRGEVVEGEVLFVNDTEVMVNIGYRSDGIISREELSNNTDVKPSDLFKPGDMINVFIMKMDDGDGNVVLSYKRVESLKIWDEIEELFNNHQRVTVTVKSVVKGGLTADLNGLNAFIPASHASVRFQRDLSKYVGKEMTCEIIDFDKLKRKIVLSRKNVETEELEKNKQEVYSALKVGDVVEGTVQRLTNFGAFVDVGGVDGLIHISELSWNRVKHPSDVVEPGQKVEVEVLNLDEDKNRIALGLKQTTKKPWDVFTESVKVGDVVEGKVVNILEFGAFVRLESGVDGLLHVSQISKEHIEKPSDKLTIGEVVTAKITDIDEENKKISLSMKALIEDEEPEVVEEVKEKVEAEPKEEVVKEKPKARAPKQPKAPKEVKEYEEQSNESNINTALGDLLGGLKFED
ncbi:4-hydroxy-3-methylbut-2-enyl diphosphate reductase [Peptoniphilus asaccharolyticus DSM 20463]|uniref:4-hydroxy-3-methylbut-2-enyl diphosphate reductase n=1 Tax=Peptoniphilus asaccharolyticus DSM 20463 TaxID=573058 RepID=A0A1W1UNK6_PEPAS|nr:bifunctional 4-hydroxy-3-methylbut-2-enyl diphosphate reductase/30S ribosomal protein S1 [Peptoniphilus asaccharolyticus]MBL7574956.1 bifunctional 4-hydroxy-3-methylbut-2-enyl diphosphate reductase/30S ribosomal protein S1 [Peptoniphilus asaccharolyticus]SMB82603.1 4-hydroxy-3-methylbut-2-enyl diphosphate reductase [Peptoniphilus asaccharolyticus DSM 20463]